MSQELLQQIPRLGALLPRPPVYLWEHFYFTPVDPETIALAGMLAAQVGARARGRRTRLASENAETIGKIGEFVMKRFLAQTETTWESNAELVRDGGRDPGDFSLGARIGDVKTRTLHEDVTIAPSFDLRIPGDAAPGLSEVFVLAGYAPDSGYGYLLGWAPAEELFARTIRTDLRFPARSMPLTDLRPMPSLATYLGRPLTDPSNLEG